MTDDRNRALCEWLGIAHLRQSAHSWASECPHYSRYLNDDQNDAACNCPRTKVYPNLATREGFWILWDALRAEGYEVELHMTGSILGDKALAKIRHGEHLCRRNHDTEPAALFEAAWALREREAGNGV